LGSVESIIIEKNVKLIVVDSIASLVRKEFDSNSVATRQGLLSKIGAILKQYAESFHIPVVITNHVVGSGNLFSQYYDSLCHCRCIILFVVE
jgi:RAD51-like protein 1